MEAEDRDIYRDRKSVNRGLGMAWRGATAEGCRVSSEVMEMVQMDSGEDVCTAVGIY